MQNTRDNAVKSHGTLWFGSCVDAVSLGFPLKSLYFDAEDDREGRKSHRIKISFISCSSAFSLLLIPLLRFFDYNVTWSIIKSHRKKERFSLYHPT